MHALACSTTTDLTGTVRVLIANHHYERAKTWPRRRSLTRSEKTAPVFASLLNRDFKPPAPNVAWCGDITVIATWEGPLYLASVIDLYSRRLIGFAIAEH